MKNKKVEIHELTPRNIPEVEVIAIGYQNECLVGYISNNSDEGEEFICESDSELLEEVTHFMFIPEI